MRLERASAKAIRYAVMNWHYSQAVPSVIVAYAVFNDAGEWCGVICYSQGANNRIASPYGLIAGQVAELVRVALNGKQEATSKAVGASMRLLKKECPLLQMIVSYADPVQNHVGTLYQATNWVYTGISSAQREVLHPETGKVMHKRTAHSLYGTVKGLLPSPLMYKLKYIYPLTKDMKQLAETLRKPYPKKPAPILEASTLARNLQVIPAPEAQTDERLDSIKEAGGSIPTPALTCLPPAYPQPRPS